jgi:23S rRNA (uracil1939-C5)-methyltransferase
VPFAAPGDRLRVRIDEASERFLRGTIESILEASPARVEPVCAHFGVCGACQLQHLNRETELRAKSEFLRDCLRRIGGIRWDGEIAITGAAEYGWRSRVGLHVLRKAGTSARVGFFRGGSRELVPIQECPVLVPTLQALVKRFASDPNSIPTDARELDLVAGDGGEVGAIPALPRGSAPGGRVRQKIAGFDFAFDAGTFSQGNRPLVESLVLRAVDGVHGATAIDLYAGAGLFTLALARRFEVVHAVEADSAAVRSGLENARRNSVENVRWHDAGVGEWLASSDRGLRPDLVLLDPPRTGAGPGVVDGIVELGPRAVTYVSCDPATWARDLRRFVARGYAISSVEALDMYPRSYHVESIARLTSTEI